MGRGQGAWPGCAGSRLRRSRSAAGGCACVRSPRRSVPGACSGEARPGASARTDGWTDGRTDSEGRWQRSRPLSGGTRREPGSPRAPRRLRHPGTGRGGRAGERAGSSSAASPAAPRPLRRRPHLRVAVGPALGGGGSPGRSAGRAPPPGRRWSGQGAGTMSSGANITYASRKRRKPVQKT